MIYSDCPILQKQLKKTLAYRQSNKTQEKEENDMQIIEEKRKEERDHYLKLRADKLQYAKENRKYRMNLTYFEQVINKKQSPEKMQETTDAKPTFYLIIKGI